MELTQLKYFLEVARTQHVTKSAETLNVAQPALTQAIHRLEKELDVPLFAQKGRNIVLTPYGTFFYEKLRPLLSTLNSLPDQLHLMAKTENTTIHLNVLAASTLVTEAIIEYQKIDDEIRIQIQQNEQNDFYDIGVTTRLFYQEPESPHNSIFVCTEKIYLAVPSSHKLAAGNSIRLAEAADEGFISLMGSRQLRLICDRYCQHAGFSAKIIFESDSPAAVRNMIAANMGIGFWPEFTWGKLDTDKVKLLEIEEPLCRRDIIIDYKLNKTDSSTVTDFFDFFTDFCRKKSKDVS